MRIRYSSGPLKGTYRDLEATGNNIGRETDNDIQLLVAGVSRYHAKIAFDGFRWSITDLNSTNGTKVNGERIQSSMILQTGDKVLIGDQEFILEENAAPEQTAAPADTVPSFVFSPITPEDVHAEPSGATVRKAVPPPDGPSAEKETNAQDKIMETLRSASVSGALFGNAVPEEEGPSAPKKKKGRLNGKLGNLLFVAFAALLVVMAAYVYHRISTEKDPEQHSAPAVAEKPFPFVLYYERLNTTANNVFRFSLLIEDGTAVFTVDDLRYRRHFVKTIPGIGEGQLARIKKSIRSGTFMKLSDGEAESSVSEETDLRTLVIAIDGKENRVVSGKERLARSFTDIEEAISNFADLQGVRVFTWNLKEVQAESERAMKTAEKLFDNYKAKPENLRTAITHYRIVLDNLGEIEPKPDEWKKAKRRVEEATKIMKKLYDELRIDIIQCEKLKKFDEAAEKCQRVMDMIGEGDRQYADFKAFKLGYEQKAATQRKRR